MNKIVTKNGLILGGFALITTSIIAITFSLTSERIEQAKESQLLSTLNQVVLPSEHDNELHLDCIVVGPSALLGNQVQRVYRSRMGGENMALIIETTAPDGYSGSIDLVVALSAAKNEMLQDGDDKQTHRSNEVLAARVVSHKETPGLGDKIELRISDWILSFTNVQYSEEVASRWQVKKDGGQFDQFTGATITPRAVVAAIKNAAIFGQNNMQTLFDMPSNCLAQEQVPYSVDNQLDDPLNASLQTINKGDSDEY
jgi:electron transport complex protein RnfG